MKWWKATLLVLVLMLAASTSFAAGFRLPEAGVKAMGMGFAFTAQADDPSAIYYNPAGLTQLDGNNVMIGGTYVYEKGGEFTGTTPVDDFATGFTTVKTERQKTLHFLIPNGYITHTDKAKGIAYGIGVFAPFGLGQEYNSVSSSIFRNQTTKIDLQTVVVNPTIAFEIDEVLSIGFGIDYMYGMATLAKTPWSPALGGNLYNLELEGDGDAWGYNFGILLKPTKNFRLGANYRSGFELDIKGGDVNLSNISAGAGLFLAGLTSTKGNAVVQMPATFAIGAAYTMDRLTVSADLDWTFWSSYKNLPITISDPRPPVLVSTNAQKNWEDVCAFRLGAEYKVTEPLALRAGFVYDPTPVPAETMGPELPDADRLNYMVGAGYKIGRWTIDTAVMYIDKKDRTVNNQNNATLTGFNGTWTGSAWLAGLDVGYKF
ncbi:MAG: rane protein involved in aromatic hydrocarbon degradation [Deltaproteobacteria bacterium]|nr:rane protein involved in aromatic hydrocarbon degradation [Deltaproteobacteria bacterium]